MSNSEMIKNAMTRSIKAIKLKPSIGIGKETMQINLDESGKTKITEGEISHTIDLSSEYGGGNTTPSPGFYVRAALGACLAQGYVVWAAYLDVTIGKINIEIQSEYDMSGGFGIDPQVRGGITQLHYIVSIESSEDPEKIQQVLDHSDAHDYVRDIFAGELAMTRELHIVPMANKS